MPRQVASSPIRVACCVALCLPALLPVGCASAKPEAQWVYFPPSPSPPRVVHLKSFNGLYEIVPRPAKRWEFLRPRTSGPSVGVPAGIDYRQDHLYICDTEFGTVHDWNLATGQATYLGSPTATLSEPVDVAIARDGTAYVADTGRGEVVVFDPAGAVLRSLTPPGHESWRPVAVAVHGQSLFVTDIASHRVHVFSTITGQHQGAFGTPGSAPGSLYFPTGVATNAGGEIHVAEMMNARVQTFDAAFNPIAHFGRRGDRYGDMGKPKHLDVAPDGTILVADAEFAHVHLFSRRGELLLLVGGPNDEPGGTPMPLGVAVVDSLPDSITSHVPDGFEVDHYFFVTNTVGRKRIALFAVGSAH